MQIHSLLNQKCEVRVTKTGRCVFAKTMIYAGERVAVFGGHVMPACAEPLLRGGGDYALQIDDDLVIGTKNENEIEDTDFFDHCCEPNAGFRGQIFLVAMRDILPDEKIRFDYAMCLHSVKGSSYQFQCECGASSCRRMVTDNDWRIPALQARYKGWFQWYLQEKINNLKDVGPHSIALVTTPQRPPSNT